MFRTTHTEPSSVSFVKRLTPCVVLAASFVLVGCGGAVEADVTIDGQLAYACTLTDHVLEEHGTPDSWEAVIGDNANPGAREAFAIGMLANGSENNAFADTGASLVDGISRLDIEGLTSSLGDMQATCDDAGISSTGDVSHAGQLDYACTLAGRITEEHGAAAEWLDGDGSAAWYEVASVAGLAGAGNAQVLSEYPELSETGVDLLMNLQRNMPDELDFSLAEFETACAEL